MNSLISFDGAADVLNNLINKIADATGWIATHSTPAREAVNTYIKGIQESSYDPITKAALISNAKKIIKEYKNQNAVVQNAMQFMLPSAKPEEVDEDWMAQFMDKTRLVSNSEIQIIWGRILAEECNCPNSVPKGLLHVLEQMDRKTATDFSNLCSVAVALENEDGEVICPIVVLGKHYKFYDDLGLNYEALVDLAAAGLIEQDFSVVTGRYMQDKLVQLSVIKYHDQEYKLPANVTEVQTGCVIFTRLGQALCKVIPAEKHEDFFEGICIPLWEA